jgi:hypothetical protein
MSCSSGSAAGRSSRIAQASPGVQNTRLCRSCWRSSSPSSPGRGAAPEEMPGRDAPRATPEATSSRNAANRQRRRRSRFPAPSTSRTVATSLTAKEVVSAASNATLIADRGKNGAPNARWNGSTGRDQRCLTGRMPSFVAVSVTGTTVVVGVVVVLERDRRWVRRRCGRRCRWRRGRRRGRRRRDEGVPRRNGRNDGWGRLCGWRRRRRRCSRRARGQRSRRARGRRRGRRRSRPSCFDDRR